jgi:hypothetical protein
MGDWQWQQSMRVVEFRRVPTRRAFRLASWHMQAL